MTGAVTVEQVWQSRAGARLSDTLLEWPPDVFALTDVILEQSEAYRFAVSPPPGQEWPPAEPPGWSTAIVAAARAWTASARARDGNVPDLVAAAWAIVKGAAHTKLATIADAEDWRLCAALLTLHAVADEACAGMGVSVEGLGEVGCAMRARGRELLTRTGSLSRCGLDSLRVLPKVRTPAGGISMRSLARYACVRQPGIDAAWHKVPSHRPGHDPRDQPANVLLLPWPLRIRASDFRVEPSSRRRLGREPFGFFDFVPAEPFDVELVDRLLVSAIDEVGVVDAVVLPESAVPEDVLDSLETVLARRGVGALLAGVRDRSTPSGQLPGNWVHVGVRMGGRWWHYRQQKHHRWSLDEGQVLQYHLGDVLDPRLRWWESMMVPQRSVQFVELGGGITVAAVVCEDLARMDAVADLLRAVGPTIVLTVLLDGPQLASRWTARYASVLADDPGSAVLTLTSFGMVERSRPDGLPPSRVVALWKDPTQGVREIPLEPGAQGILLSARIDTATRHSADGRWPADDTTRLRRVGIFQVHAPDGVRRAEPNRSVPSPRDASIAEFDEADLTVLASWAEAVVDAGSNVAALDEVLADASPDAGWREGLGLRPPSPSLADALNVLGRVARRGEMADVHRELGRLIQSLLCPASDRRDRAADSGRG